MSFLRPNTILQSLSMRCTGKKELLGVVPETLAPSKLVGFLLLVRSLVQQGLEVGTVKDCLSALLPFLCLLDQLSLIHWL